MCLSPTISANPIIFSLIIVMEHLQNDFPNAWAKPRCFLWAPMRRILTTMVLLTCKPLTCWQKIIRHRKCTAARRILISSNYFLPAVSITNTAAICCRKTMATVPLVKWASCRVFLIPIGVGRHCSLTMIMMDTKICL